jgi:(2R)-3-sulfolactate dehydrogenase (NADP+)
MPCLPPDALRSLAERALRASGAGVLMAAATANKLVAAEMQGLSTHGVSRIPFYCAMLRNGRADGAATPAIVAARGATCLIDNRDGLPYESCLLAVNEALKRAREFGIGFAGIANSGHVGALALHLEPVAASEMIGVALSNSPAAIPAWGGKRALLGTNPVAALFPRRHADPLVVDLSLTTVTRGRIMLALQRGEPIPEGWALDREGRPTRDPEAALDGGSLFPAGGVKGAMLALVFELLCCALTGAAFAFEADSFFAERGNRPRIGQAFLAIDPGALAGREIYLDRVEALVAAMLAEESVRLPGARRMALASRAREHGIEIPDALHEQITHLAGA